MNELHSAAWAELDSTAFGLPAGTGRATLRAVLKLAPQGTLPPARGAQTGCAPSSLDPADAAKRPLSFWAYQVGDLRARIGRAHDRAAAHP